MTPPPIGPIFTMALHLSNGQSLQDAFVAQTTLGAEKAQIIAQEYRKFLHLVATGQGPAVPFQVLDFMWNLHIEDTRAYQALCDAAFGQFVHHTLGRAPQAQDPAYAQTLERYEQVFGTAPDRRVWPSLADFTRERWVGWTLVCGFVLVFMGFPIAKIGTPALSLTLLLIGMLLCFGGVVAVFTSRTWSIGGANGTGCGGD